MLTRMMNKAKRKKNGAKFQFVIRVPRNIDDKIK